MEQGLQDKEQKSSLYASVKMERCAQKKRRTKEHAQLYKKGEDGNQDQCTRGRSRVAYHT